MVVNAFGAGTETITTPEVRTALTRSFALERRVEAPTGLRLLDDLHRGGDVTSRRARQSFSLRLRGTYDLDMAY